MYVKILCNGLVIYQGYLDAKLIPAWDKGEFRVVPIAVETEYEGR